MGPGGQTAGSPDFFMMTLFFDTTVGMNHNMTIRQVAGNVSRRLPAVSQVIYTRKREDIGEAADNLAGAILW